MASQRVSFPMHRSFKRPSGGWAACMVALAASATAATSAAALRSDETRLESGRIGFGKMNVLSHFTQQQQHQQKRNTAVMGGAADHDALLMARNAHRWVQPASTLRTKKIQHEYDLQGVIGEGGFGRVHVARHRATNAQVAIKRVFKETTTKEKFMQEVAILRHLNGGNSSVLQLREAFETADAYVLVTELVQGGELYDNLVENGVFDEKRARSLTREIAQTLAFLHAKSVVHGDIKPENILLSENKNSKNNSSGMRLIDFGQAFREDKVLERVRAIGSGVGTTAYAAPEYIRKSEASAAVDVWALGVVLYIVLCGRHPFDPTNDSSDDEMTTRILAGDFECDSREWKGMSEQARDLIQRMLTVDASARITADEVLAHEWIQGAIRA